MRVNGLQVPTTAIPTPLHGTAFSKAMAIFQCIQPRFVHFKNLIDLKFPEYTTYVLFAFGLTSRKKPNIDLQLFYNIEFLPLLFCEYQTHIVLLDSFKSGFTPR
jgi:hypothetical protein